ncbi:class I SAM-dependent methyltransferase [Prochlorococcus marinus]|uniref:class I SAM-dependent methyltransferase n=1 Tax=Prochlorococcus marinus TaxID=1219 RepID=UPI0022B2C991|nr:methyltransferase domain-containing protein [Prochlorococcus marinus]
MQNLSIEDFLQDGFNLKEHLSNYLKLEPQELERELSSGLNNMSSIHPGAFNSENATHFYEDQVGTSHLFDLAAWHLGSSSYIADTLRLQKMFARGKVLDFGGGIGTHALAAAALDTVERVFFVDLNPINREFVLQRASQMGISDLISVHRDLDSIDSLQFDTLICLDVLEHLPNPSKQLLIFKDLLSSGSVALLNWYFFKGNNGEYPFHFDEKEIVEEFFITLQSNFMEIFHPLLITTRAYTLINK